MTTTKLTDAILKALEVLEAADGGDYAARRSNYTGEAHHDATRAHAVYWQSADYLIKNGLAEGTQPGDTELIITHAGRDALRLERQRRRTQ